MATKKEAVNTDSNARFGGEVEWNVSGNDCLLVRRLAQNTPRQWAHQLRCKAGRLVTQLLRAWPRNTVCSLRLFGDCRRSRPCPLSDVIRIIYAH